jgi:copper chaperone
MENAVTRTYRVGGMSCEGCVRAVTRAIARRAPEAAVAVDLAVGRVTVGGDIAPEAVAAAVSEAGFAFDGLADAPA